MNKTTAFSGGVSYYPDHWPEAEWERDMKLIRDSGLATIRFGELNWSWFEPRERQFDFAGCDRFMDLADRLGLKVLLCTPTASAPPWLLHRYPDARRVDNAGLPHTGGRQMTNYNHPAARALAEEVIVKLAERYRPHPALMGWQIDNEPTMGESAKLERLFDYGPIQHKLFRQWLQAKYDSLDQLNREWVNNFWSRAYSSWEEIEPPLKPGIPSLWLEWLRFRMHDLVQMVHWQRDLLRSVKRDFLLGINIPICGPSGSARHGQDYWRQCEGLDFAGTDIYDFQRDPQQEDRITALVCDLMRSVADAVGAEFWVSETQAGPHRLPWRMTFAGGLWDSDFLRRCTHVSAAHGARKVIYFLWRPVRGGQEFGMNGLVNFDGTPHEITAAVPQILAEAQSIPDISVGLPEAVLHYSNDSNMLGSGYDPDGTCSTAVHGWHFLLEDMGFQVRYVNDAELRKRAWRTDDFLILPYTLVLDESTAVAIRGAVQSGARLAAGFGTGFFNEYGTISLHAPGYGLEEPLGVRIQAFDSIPARLAPHVAGKKELILDVLLASFTTNDADVVGWTSREQPLISRRGNAAYFGFDIGTFYGKANELQRQQLRTLVESTFPEVKTVRADRPSSAPKSPVLCTSPENAS